MALITEKRIEALKPKRGSTRWIWDSELIGFGVRVYPSGNKAFVTRHKEDRRLKIEVLASVEALSLEAARAQAAQALRVRGLSRTAHRRLKTVTEISTFYLDHYSRLHKKSWRDDQRRIFKHIIPAFGPMALNRVSKLDLLSLHERISITAPMEANRVIELFKAIFERAREWDLVCGDNPARRFRKNRERSRARWLTREELLRLFAVLQNEDIYTRSAIFLWLLTGVRKNELLQAEWCQVDIPGRRMILAETKNGEDRIVQLSGAAVGLLEELPKAGRFVFPSPVIPDQALTDFKKPWARVRRAAGLKDATIHDLRRTMGSHLAQAGYSLHIIGRILGHKSLTTTKIYARLQAEPLIAAVEAHSERLMQIASEAA